MISFNKDEIWDQLAKGSASNSNTYESENKDQQNKENSVEPSNAAQEEEANFEKPADSGDSIELSPDASTLAVTSTQEEKADTSSSSQHGWENAKSLRTAAMHAHGFGLDVVPVLPGTTDLAVDRESWLDGLGPEKIVSYWRDNPDHEPACMPGDDIIVIVADSPGAIAALAEIETRLGVTPLFVVKTNTGEEHYYRRPAGTIVQGDSQSSEKHPDLLSIITGQVCVTLPPALGKSFKVISAENKEELPEARQEVIDAIIHYNDGIVPSQSSDSSAQEETENPSSQTSEPEAATESPDISALATPQGFQPARIRPSCLDNPQPLDSKLFPNQPRAGSTQLPATLNNIEYLINKYNITIRYNVIKKKLQINLPGHIGTTDNEDNVTLTRILSLAALNGLSTRHIPAFLEAIADLNMYNPVAEWILGTPWDGKDRLPEIYKTITTQEDYPENLKEILMYKWLLSAVAAALKPRGFRARGVLVFQGTQSVGKTSWLLSLINDELLRDMVVKDNHQLDGNNKDSIIGAVTHWLVEMGELDSSFKKDIARLKGFLTSNFDKLRRPYGRTESEYQRRTVFMATVNQSDFLVDTTGNSRWWTIKVSKVNYEHGIDMQQLFAQLAVDFNNGKQWWLTPEEEALLNTWNLNHRSVSVIRERLLELIDLDLIGQDGNPAMTATNVLEELDYKNPTNPQCKECGGILRELLGEPKKIRGVYKWRIPLKRTTGRSYTSIDEDMY